MRSLLFLVLVACGSGPSISSSDSGVSGTSLENDRRRVKVKIAPEDTVQAQPGESVQFTATVTGTDETKVNWTASAGAIDADGMFTAPELAGRYTVTASSVSASASTASVTVVVGGGAARGDVPQDLPRTCYRAGQSLLQVTVKVTQYKGTQHGRNGEHELVVGDIVETVFNENPEVMDTNSVQLAMNISSDTNRDGLPQEIPMRAGDLMEVQGIYIADRDTDSLDVAVIHFTHDPCGWVKINGAVYE